jgi:cytoskeleton protein RodZ
LPITAAEQESNVDAQNVGDASTLEMAFDAPCWVSIKDSNQKRLASGLMDAGKTLKLTGLAPFQVVLGKASAVKIWINGNEVNIDQYTDNEVAKIKIDGEPLSLSAIESDSLSSLF